MTAPQDCQHGAFDIAGRSVNHYDAPNLRLFIDHPSNTEDLGSAYEPDGALASATAGVLNPQAADWKTVRNRSAYADPSAIPNPHSQTPS